MRITYLINQYPKVSHSFVRREILALERQGFDVQRIAQRGWNDQVVDQEDAKEREKTLYIVKQGIVSIFLSMLSVLLSCPGKFFSTLLLSIQISKKSDRSLLFHLIYFAEACRMQAWLKLHQSQHIHAHFGTNSAEIAMFASQISGVPYSFTVHGPEEFDKPQSLGLATKITHAKFVVAISSFGRSQLYRWTNFEHWQKIKVVHCGLEKAFYENPEPIKASPISMVCVGRICEQKGQLLLIEAANRLHQSGRDFRLILAGDGEMRPEIESLIAQYGLGNKITITGWISSAQVREYILGSQFLVLPSFAEGLPVVIMEAMSLRRPVISTYIAGIPELVIHGENGWLSVAGDVEDLTSTIAQALDTPDAALKKMGDLAYDRVLARHHIDVEAEKLAGYFKQ
jgi:colanic acid/amylovoran biosynthesis glycosyltransferase